MPGINDIFAKIGGMFGAKVPKTGQRGPPSVQAGLKPAAGGTSEGSPPFDINMYFKAVGIFFNDFFSKKIPYFFKNIGPVMKNFPIWWGNQRQDEQIAYAMLLLGHIVLVVGIVLLIVM